METATAYLETFGCQLETEDDHDHPGDCDWGFSCITCGRRVDDGPCPEHAPLETPGLLLVGCDATPRHYSWVLAHNGYEGPCWQCVYLDLQARHDGCEHKQHRAWCRWKLTHKMAGWGYQIGFVKSSGYAYGGGCSGCMSHFKWGASSYLLGWDRWKWETLRWCLRRGHWPIGIDECSRASDGREMNFCVKCSPCPGCWTCKPAEAVSRA